MNVVIDTNILISILIKPDGKVAELFFRLKEAGILIISDYSFTELIAHENKIKKFSKLSAIEFEQLKLSLLNSFQVVSTDILPGNYLVDAFNLCKDVDIKDVPFVALAIYVEGFLWTGDKKIYKALRTKGFNQILNSKDIEILLSNE